MVWRWNEDVGQTIVTLTLIIFWSNYLLYGKLIAESFEFRHLLCETHTSYLAPVSIQSLSEHVRQNNSET